MPTFSLQELLALERGAVPAFEPLRSLVEHTINNEAAIQALDLGQAPGYPNGPYQLTYVVDTGSANAITCTVPQGPTGSDTLAAGYELDIKVNAANTGATTLDIGTTEGPVAVNKNGNVALAGGELKAGRIDRFQYDGSVWQWRGWRADALALSDVVGKQPIPVPAVAMTPQTTSPPELFQNEISANNPEVIGYAFDGAADEALQFILELPKAWNEGTITFKAHWTSSAADTDGVAWGIQAVALSDGDAINTAFGTAVVVTDAAQGVAWDHYVTAESGAITIAGTPAEGDLVRFRVFRDVSDVSDTMTEDAILELITVYFTTNAATDD